MAKSNVYDTARYLGKKSGMASEDQSRSDNKKLHPSASSGRARSKPKETAMAPREGNKRKEYGRKMEDKPTLKGGKYK